MTRLVELTEQAFAPLGPVQRALTKGPVMQPHRPEQAQGALVVARTLARGRTQVRRTAADGTETVTDAVGLSPFEVGTGVGKTLMYMVPLAIQWALTGQRALVSTHTIALRQQILAGPDGRPLAEVLSEILWRLGLIGFGDEITVAERPSSTAYASFQRWKWLSRFRGGMDDSEQRGHLDRYLAWAARAAGWSMAVKPVPGQMRFPLLAEWLSNPESGGRYPLDLGELDLCLTEQETRWGHAVADGFAAATKKARSADIVVITHTMLLYNNITFGNLAGTNSKEGDDSPQIRALVIDEADQLPDVAYNVGERMVPLMRLDDELAAIEVSGDSDTLRKVARDLLADLLAYLHSLYGANPQSLHTLANRTLVTAVGERVDALLAALREFLEANDPDDPVELIAVERIRRMAGNLEPVVQIYNNRTSTSEAESVKISQTDDIALAEFIPSLVPGSPPLVRLGVKPRLPANLIQPLWRYHRLMTFDTVTLVSGSLLGEKRDLATAMRRLGISTGIDHVNTDLLPAKPIHPAVFGALTEVVYAAPTAPAPTLAKPRLRVRVDRTEFLDYTNPDHTAYVANALSWVARHRPGRTLGLFASQQAMDDAVELLEKAGLGDRLVIQNAGQRSHQLMDAFRAKPDGIWLGLNWEGINFVDTEGRSLLTTVVVTRIPMMPADPASIRFHGYRMTLEDLRDRAFRRIVQGLGRGIRSPNDEIGFWNLDPRWPLPRHLAVGLRMGWNEAQARFLAFQETIPERFRENTFDYSFDDLCRVFTEDGQLVGLAGLQKAAE